MARRLTYYQLLLLQCLRRAEGDWVSSSALLTQLVGEGMRLPRHFRVAHVASGLEKRGLLERETSRDESGRISARQRVTEAGRDAVEREVGG